MPPTKRVNIGLGGVPLEKDPFFFTRETAGGSMLTDIFFFVSQLLSGII